MEVRDLDFIACRCMHHGLPWHWPPHCGFGGQQRHLRCHSQANEEVSGGDTNRGTNSGRSRRSGGHARGGSQIHSQRQIQ